MRLEDVALEFIPFKKAVPNAENLEHGPHPFHNDAHFQSAGRMPLSDEDSNTVKWAALACGR